MKPAQTALLLVILVGMVFGVTFVAMYNRQEPAAPAKPPPDAGAGSSARLSFAALAYPKQPVPPDPVDRQRVAGEFGVTGHADFWFVNETDEDVRVGLYTKNCKCSE